MVIMVMLLVVANLVLCAMHLKMSSGKCMDEIDALASFPGSSSWGGEMREPGEG